MSTLVHWILPAGSLPGAALRSLAHGRFRCGGIARLHLYAPSQPAHRRTAFEALARFARTEFPEIEVTLWPADPQPATFRQFLLDALATAQDHPAVIDLSGVAAPAASAAFDLLGRPALRLLERRESGAWIEWLRDPAGALRESPLDDAARRDDTDEFPLPQLLHAARSADGDIIGATAIESVSALPVVEITDAAIRAQWNWPTAFQNAGLDATHTYDSFLFERFLAGLLAGLGLRHVVHRPASHRTPAQRRRDAPLWVAHAGRRVAFEADLAEFDTSQPDAESALIQDLQRAHDRRVAHDLLAPDWVLIRPTLRASPTLQTIARMLGLRLLDADACAQLPTRLAEIFDQPLSSDAAEVERRLRLHLAGSGNTRVFVPEPTTIQTLQSTGSDPSVVQIDAFLAQIRKQRAQNWLAWLHRDRLLLHLPTDQRPNAAADWSILVAGLTGVAPDQILTSTDARQTSVVLDLPHSHPTRSALVDWLRPFLNGSLTFVLAQARFAAMAGLAQEAPSGTTAPQGPQAISPTAPTPADRSRPNPPPRAHSTPSRTPAPGSGSRLRPPADRPRTARPPSAPINPMRDALADLDSALDQALGGPDPKK